MNTKVLQVISVPQLILGNLTCSVGWVRMGAGQFKGAGSDQSGCRKSPEIHPG